MPCQIKNPANIDLSSLGPHVNGMYDHFSQKFGFKKPPVMVFDSDPSNKANVLGKTAYYDPSSFEIHVYTDGRHPKDMLRSIAHELIHHRQNLEGRLNVGGYQGEGYYLKNKELKKLEQEAMKDGNETLREYEDGLKLKRNEKMSLKEWKNNELNKLLMKKFGILKENKKEYDLEENQDRVFAPNHYCAHHVVHEGKKGVTVDHNWNESLQKVTKYDMEFEDGTILEGVSAEDILVTNASLAEGHGGHAAKRDDDKKEKEEEVNEADGQNFSFKASELPPKLKTLHNQLKEFGKEAKVYQVYGASSKEDALKMLRSKLQQRLQQAKKKQKKNENWTKGNKDQLLFERLVEKWTK